MTDRSIAVLSIALYEGAIGWLCEQPCRERRSASGVGCRFDTARRLAVNGTWYGSATEVGSDASTTAPTRASGSTTMGHGP